MRNSGKVIAEPKELIRRVEKMSEVLRELFYSRIRDQIYIYLKGGVLRAWQPAVIYKLVDSVIEAKMPEIDSYLLNYVVKLDSIDAGVNHVVNRILIPYVRSLRVQ